MCFIYKCLRSSIRNNFFLIFGLFLGVGLSAFMSQLVENQCIFSTRSASEQRRKPELSAAITEEDYEPVINLAGKPSKAQKTPQDFQRPRYYRTELGIREKLFAAVLTSPKTIQSNGIPFNKTTNHLFDKTVFFMESEPSRAKSDVKLNGVVQFSDTRLMLKPFHMLKYIADNYLDDYDYFFLVRDTTFVRARNLLNLVKSISISENIHLGSKIPDEPSSFCTLDAGILVSNLVLKKVIQNLDWCVKNAFSDSDDANVGRCIIHSTGLPCSDDSQGLKLHSYRFAEHIKSLEYEKLEKNEAFVRAITIWPVESAQVMYKLHIHFAKVDLLRTNLEIASARRAIVNISAELPDNITSKITWPIGSQPPSKPSNRFDLQRWDYFNEEKIFLSSDFTNVDDLEGANLIDVQHVINASIQFIKSKYDDQLQFKRFLNGYRKFDPARGMDYILDLAFKDTSTGRESHKRIEVCKSLSKVELIPVPYVTENTRINMVLTVSENNKEEVLRFIDNYVTVCMEKRDKTHLMLVLLYGVNQPGKGEKNDVYFQVKKQATKYSDRFKKDGNKISWLSIKLPDAERLWTSNKRVDDKVIGLNPGILKIAVLDLVVKKFMWENLILFCTSSMEIRQDYLNRVRMNTIKEWQIFSPIPFSEFDPKIVYNQDLVRPKEMDINKNYGHYDDLNTDHISFYVQDYRSVRKKIEEFIPIVHSDKNLNDLAKHFNKQLDKLRSDDRLTLGKMYDFNSLKDSDVFVGNLTQFSLNSVYNMFVGYGNLTVLRAVEPGLRLRHILEDCSKIATPDDLFKPALYRNCVEKRNFNAGTRSHLGSLILQSLKDANAEYSIFHK